jgi:hypothetical protein
LFSQQNVSSQKKQNNAQQLEEIQIVIKDRSAIERSQTGQFLRFKTAAFRGVMAKFSLNDADIQPTYPDYNDPFPNKDTAFIIQHPHGFPYVSSNSPSKSFILRLRQQQNVDSIVTALRQLPEIEGVGQRPKNFMAIDEQFISNSISPP